MSILVKLEALELSKKYLTSQDLREELERRLRYVQTSGEVVEILLDMIQIQYMEKTELRFS